MTKRLHRVPQIAADIALNRAVSMPLHRQLYDRLRHAILSGQLQPGQRLPSTRILASELGISRNTASNAYEQLYAEGYLERKVG
jgi:GntR family transcriptional regulator / MocR family aminotransferase